MFVNKITYALFPLNQIKHNTVSVCKSTNLVDHFTSLLASAIAYMIKKKLFHRPTHAYIAKKSKSKSSQIL